MDVVEHDDPFQFLHLAAKLVHIDVLRGALKKHMDNLGEQTPRAEQDEEADEHAHDGVGEHPPEGPDEDA